MATDGLNAFDEETRCYLLRATGKLRRPPGPPANPNVSAAATEIIETRKRKGWKHMPQGGRAAICKKWGVTTCAVNNEMARRHQVARSRLLAPSR